MRCVIRHRKDTVSIEWNITRHDYVYRSWPCFHIEQYLYAKNNWLIEHLTVLEDKTV